MQANLDRVAQCAVWDQGLFSLSKTAIESLIDALIPLTAPCVFNRDDVTFIRLPDFKFLSSDNRSTDLSLTPG